MSAAVLRNVTVRYGDRVALDRVSLSLGTERVALLGPSGAGKSTLLDVLNGTVAPTDGTVELLGCDPWRLASRPRRRLAGRIGMLHQQLHLVGPLRVVHNVNAGLLGRWSTARALWSLVRPDVTAAGQALAAVGLADRLHDRTDTLSGGQQQRVALARVLAQDPDLVLADEPVSSLDPGLSAAVMELLTTVVAGRALVVSLHDAALARRWCDRAVGLSGGRVVFDLPVAEVGDSQLRTLYALPA